MKNNLYNVYDVDCPSRVVLDIISDKWVILIIQKLSTDTYRFGKLKQEITGISPKVLTEKLKLLEKHGIVLRVKYEERTLKVEYSLTQIGLSLSQICNQITDWAEKNIHKINSLLK